MPTEIDRQIDRASEVLNRSRERYTSLNARARKRREGEIVRRVGRIAAADGLIIVAAMVIGFFVPLGMFGALLVMALLIAATLFFGIMPGSATVEPEKFGEAPLGTLPLRTEEWLDRQRPTLPGAAMPLVDSIGVKLDVLASQLKSLNEGEPAAAEVRKLVGEQLPELIKGYQRVPDNLRSVDRFGQSPDRQLVDGLALIDQEIAQMSAQLAQGDLDALATRGRYLQVKYRGDDTVTGE
ncbi:hypothetical protein [Sphingomonas turrisvirgatae]|uniref:Uncharacterized protein n=1 Tax=Sphingomonas turrisvirgatae TaxID=1888892 RepID=A0A1E3LZY0_9SPHN|nr:hypothetical protein [Sphingomonas turrisvirgatae]ODP39377.1 hypothetical protein BFL28_09820 [Sphingomonas turrisvirgatae]